MAKSPLEVLTVDNDFLTGKAWAENLEAAREDIIARWGETIYRRIGLYLWGSSQACLSGGADAIRIVLERPTGGLQKRTSQAARTETPTGA